MTGVITLGLLPGQSAEIPGISAARRWNRTELLLEAGVVYTFEVVSFTAWRDNSRETDPNGYSSLARIPFIPLRRHPFAKWMKLIGVAGMSAADYFPIGMKTRRRIRSAGELYCFANDTSFWYKDNEGELTLRVTREAE